MRQNINIKKYYVQSIMTDSSSGYLDRSVTNTVESSAAASQLLASSPFWRRIPVFVFESYLNKNMNSKKNMNTK